MCVCACAMRCTSTEHKTKTNHAQLPPPCLRIQPGVVVLKCDNRGSARRGLKFEGALRCAFGTVEVRDQEDAVQVLVGELIGEGKGRDVCVVCGGG